MVSEEEHHNAAD